MVVTERSLAIGNRIRQKREEVGMSQEDLSKFLGGSKSLAWTYEKGRAMPNSDRFEKIAELLHTTVLYLQTGVDNGEQTIEEEEEIEEPMTLKQAYSNHEGYSDPTAAKAVAIVMTKDPEVKVGEVYAYNDSSQTVVILRILDNRALVAPLNTRTPKNNTSFSVCCWKNNDDTYYVDLNYIQSRDINTIVNKATKKFIASEICINVMISKLQKVLGYNIPETKKEVKPVETPVLDETSIMFAESVKYFNEKNGTSFPVPAGIVSLKDAIDISKGMNISLSEFTKDHTEDKILDEICKHEEIIKQLKAKIGLE